MAEQDNASQRAFIPSSTLEFPIQRRWAASIFVLIQALKCVDLFALYTAEYPELYDGIVSKWLLFDALYFIILYFARIPWLQFSLFKTILLIVLMSLLDLFLFAYPTVFVGIFFSNFIGDVFGHQVGVSQARMINAKDVILNSSHILGRHTVHILPFGTAKLNPGDVYYCLPQGQNKDAVYIPVVLNNTVPQKLTLTRHDFDTGIHAAHEYSIKDLQRATETGNAMNGIESYYIPVRKPGAYSVSKIISKDGVDVRLYRRQAFVFTCPTAQFKQSQNVDHCTGSKETLEIEITGVPPLKVEYLQKLGAKSSSRELNRIQPPEFSSPLQRLSKGLASVDPSFFTTSTYDDLTWATTQTISMTLNLTFDEAIHHDYNLVRVIDGAGNIVDLSNKAPQVFNIHRRPVAKLQCSMTKPTNLLIGQKSVPLPLSLEGTGPFHIDYNFVPEDSDEVRPNNLLAKTNRETIPAQGPGMYNLLSVRDAYCQGDVFHPSSCQVVQPPLPIVKLQSTPIPSECTSDSEVGMRFVTEFEGLKPYLLEYTVSKHNGRNKVIVERKTEKVDHSRHIFSYYPSSSGEYTYEFVALSDGNYKKLNPHIQSIQQVVHPQPDAKFDSRNRHAVRICLAEKTSVDVDLTGNGPFTLHWTLDGQPHSEVVEGNKHVIQLPVLNSTGQHIVSLTQIQDSNNCIKDLESRDFTIDVRRDRPTAFFYTGDTQDRTVEIQQGAKAILPLRLTGEGPWYVTYRNVELGDRSKVTQRFDDPNAEIQVEDIGHYELLNVEDAVCKGDVLPPQYIVRWIDKPTLAIAENQAHMMGTGVYERPAVCQGVSDAIDIQFTGRGPFYCSYKQYRGLTGKRDYSLISTEEITSGLTRVHLPLMTRQNGKYRYVFDKLSDQRYTQPFQVSALQIEQTVYATPSVAFRSRSRKERVLCVGDNLSSSEMAPIVLDLTGQAPFTVKLNIRHHSQVGGKTITLEDIDTSTFTLKLTDELDMAGQYFLQLVGVSDANGCEADVKDSDNTRITIKTLDIASISPIEGCGDVCVGDNLEYSLSGVGPFTISYLFNDKKEKISSPHSKLSMLADKPGNVTILSVGDNRNKCRSFPKNMSRIIHEVPSSYVSGGKDIIENIRQGDMVQAVIDLVGTPPFDFDWQRSELKWDNAKGRYYKGSVVESHSVYGVEGHRYVIDTSTEGVIEVRNI
ncbi:hypothetical protein K501DRAFT_191122 [Backusella circina FSU 941]|nr:hypothetical protein K501DRAFT_191122 [Backusella circina FSU 941]